MNRKILIRVTLEIAIFCVSLLAACGVFILAFPILQGSVTTVFFIPAMVSGFLWRIRGSLFGSTITIILISLMYQFIGQSTGGVPAQGFFNYFIMVIVAILVGTLRNAQSSLQKNSVKLAEKEKELQKEVELKTKIEDQLALAMDYLESEISRTKNKLDSTSKALDERHKLLEVAELTAIKSLRQLRMILDTFGIMFINIDMAERRVLLVSRASEMIYGFDEKDFIEDPDLWLERVIMEDRKEIEDFLRNEPRGQKDFFVRSLHLSGEMKYLNIKLIRVSPEGMGGRIYGLIQDVTGIKQTERMLRNSLEEKDTLIKEVHHRVKNNLQIIISMMNLEKHRFPDGESQVILDELTRRFQSMATLHENVYITKNFMQVDLSVYLRGTIVQALSEKKSPLKSKLDFSLEPIFVSLDTAIPCGMVFYDVINGIIEMDLSRNHIWKISLINQEGCGYFSLSMEPFDDRLKNILELPLLSIYLHQLSAQAGINNENGLFIKFPGARKNKEEF